MLRCILGDGSYFCGDRDDAITETIHLHCIPNALRFSIVFDDIPALLPEDLIDKAHDADYLHYQEALDNCICELSKFVELATDELLEYMMINLAPQVLDRILSQVDCHTLGKVNVIPYDFISKMCYVEFDIELPDDKDFAKEIVARLKENHDEVKVIQRGDLVHFKCRPE